LKVVVLVEECVNIRLPGERLKMFERPTAGREKRGGVDEVSEESKQGTAGRINLETSMRC
jgi:hypothetical protein